MSIENQEQLQEAINQCVKMVQKSVQSSEKRFSVRALMVLNASTLRASFSPSLLGSAVNQFVLGQKKTQLLSLLSFKADASLAAKAVEPEVEVYLGLLVAVFLLDQKRLEEGQKLSAMLIEESQKLNSRSLDPIAAKLYFFYAAMFCKDNASIRPQLLDALRVATLRHDQFSCATLINLILRNYLRHDLYNQAEKFVAQTTFPEKIASNNESARYMYYVGRIKAVMLSYSDARASLLQAIRKAPSGLHLDKKTKLNVQSTSGAQKLLLTQEEQAEEPLTPSKGAIGFLQAAYVTYITVQLLMGEIPDRTDFRVPILRTTLEPYYHLVVAVRNGDLAMFQQVLQQFQAKFEIHKTLAMVQRLRHNVIKTGIRLISLSYSKISLRDICMKLNLDSEEDAEYIVAKAIADGVIDAHIDHKGAFLQSRETKDVYASSEPQHAYNTRIEYCLQLRNESVKALRYPDVEGTKSVVKKTDEQAALEAELATLDEADFEDDEDEF